MIPGLPNPYLLLATLVALLGMFVGGDLYRGHQDKIAYGGAMAKLEAAAVTTLAAETAKSAATDARNAELANEVDRTNAKAIADIDATRADFSRRLRIASSRKGDSCATTAQASDSSVSAPVTSRSDDGSGRADIDAGERLRDAALKLQQYAKVCNAWSLEVGR